MIEAMPPPAREAAWCEFARAPLVPVALGAAVGLAADRAFTIPMEAGFLVAPRLVERLETIDIAR